METKALIESIDRVSVVISDKLKSPVRCLFDHDKVMLSAKTGNGEAKDVCRVIGDGNKLEIGFNNRYLMEALRYAPAEKVKIELNTGVSPAIVVPVAVSYTHLAWNRRKRAAFFHNVETNWENQNHLCECPLSERKPPCRNDRAVFYAIYLLSRSKATITRRLGSTPVE